MPSTWTRASIVLLSVHIVDVVSRRLHKWPEDILDSAAHRL